MKTREEGDKVGPGSYDVNKLDVVKKSNPRWTISGKYRRDSKEESPGPGKYETLVPSKSPLFTIGIRFRKPKRNADDPVGPASYNTQTDFYSKTGISFTKDKQRLDSSLGSRKNPGPDRYFNLDRKKIKGGVIGTTKHLNDKIALELTPGPGSYETLS